VTAAGDAPHGPRGGRHTRGPRSEIDGVDDRGEVFRGRAAAAADDADAELGDELALRLGEPGRVQRVDGRPVLEVNGMPAFGITLIGSRDWRARVRTCSRMSAGPVAQFMPSTSIASGSSAAIAASGSVPSSIVLMSFSTVNCTINGTRAPRSTNTSLRRRRRP
jgi:hypothetical protein